MSDATGILSLDELPTSIQDAFYETYKIEKKIEQLRAKYIDGLMSERLEVKRALKAKTDIASKDIDLRYKVFKRLQDAAAMENEDEGRAIQENIRRLFATTAIGQTVDFMDALDPDASAAEAEVASEQEAEAPSPVVASEPPVLMSDPDWGDNSAPVPSAENDGSAAGFAFNAGEADSLAGLTDPRPQIKAAGWHPRSLLAKSYREGWAAGQRKLSRSTDADAGGFAVAVEDDDLVDYHPAIALPVVSTSGAVPPGAAS